MASIRNILFMFAILVSSTGAWAQGPHSNESNSNEIAPPHENGDGPSEEPLAPSGPPGRFQDFDFKGPKHDGSQFPGAGFLARNDTRQRRATNRRVFRCNYSTEGGYRCTGCHTARRCYPVGLAVESTCTGRRQYCNNGFCSSTEGSMCSDTTSTSTSSTAVSTSSTSDSSSTTGSTSTSSSSSTSGSSSTSESSSTSVSSSTSSSSSTSESSSTSGSSTT